MSSAAVGGIYVLLFIGVLVFLFVYLPNKIGPKIAAKRRDQEIETAMRLGMRDAEAQERIARKLQDEQEGRY